MTHYVTQFISNACEYLYCSKLCEFKFKFKIMKKIFDSRKCDRKLDYDYAFLLHNIVRILFINF